MVSVDDDCGDDVNYDVCECIVGLCLMFEGEVCEEMYVWLLCEDFV